MKSYPWPLLICLMLGWSCKPTIKPLSSEFALEILPLSLREGLPKNKVSDIRKLKPFKGKLKVGADFTRFSSSEQAASNLDKTATYHIRQFKNKTLLFESYSNKSPLEMSLDKTKRNNPIQQALGLMQPGDSLALTLDSDYWELLPKGFTNKDQMLIELRLLGIENLVLSENRTKQLLAIGENYPDKIKANLLNLDKSNIEQGRDGIQRLIVAAGEGNTIQNQSKVRVHFIGMKSNGDVFRNTYLDKIPREFVQGERGMIQGWQDGVEEMQSGGRYLLFVPYAAGYGKAGNELLKIPAEQDLVFYIEVLKVNND